MANQYFGLSPEAFEQFVRALALSVFGPGVTAFGNGPDGGREATFRGKVPYPYPPATEWSGYGVIQAKCKEKPETTEKDQKWALKLLDDELKAFVTSTKRDPKPEYYVFVTNVELTSAGGRDKADKLVQSYYRKLPLKDHAVWDANQLTGFLTKYEELRRRFTAYLTPGDVLAAMLAAIERRRPSATHILTAFLERELRADDASRLDQAGNRTDEQLRLARLFFDLPASAEPRLLPPEEKPDSSGQLPRGVLGELLREGSRKLDPTTLYEQETAGVDGQSEPFPTRYVLLGGPGSGKSTLGQFLAQAHRAALLERCTPQSLEPQTRQSIADIRALCERDGLPWPVTPRYPFRVELNRFAKALASVESDHVGSLERYLLNALKREHALTHEDLIEWLGTYPWLLILDGLDEVPATSNRDAVVQAVNDFLAEARQAGADLFVIATSRQQGYGGEFASGVVAFRHILPLSTTRALQYVERYAQARFGNSDPNRAQDLVDQLRRSATRELTAQLMSSPLQVTFMATVVAARGDPGEDRWQLFARYYQTIYDRERQKAVPPYDAILSKQQPIIDRLHHDVGFWLQYRGETVGDRAVSLPIDQFKGLVSGYLAEAGHEAAEKGRLVKHITEAAHHRLVFLTSRVEGELSFDVRSLQEYMASECLMTGHPSDPDVVRNRLRAIAPSPYWRNVFLFAVGKCFADAQSRHLQDAVRLLCEDLNGPGDVMLAAVRAGSELALDVLQSGIVSENPNYGRHLARIALALLAEPYLTDQASASARLQLVYRESLATVYGEALELRVGQAHVSRTLGAWPLLIRLVDRRIGWAAKLAERCWPADPQAQLDLVKQLVPAFQHVVWLRQKLNELIPEIAPEETWAVIRAFGQKSELPDGLTQLNVLMSPEFGGPRIRLRAGQEELEGCELRVVRLASRKSDVMKVFASLARLLPRRPDWLPFILAPEFLRAPSRHTLSKVLRECVDGHWDPSRKLWLHRLPWPMAACLDSVQSLDQLRVLARHVETGRLGDLDDWRAAERRWAAWGVELQEFAQRPAGLEPFDRSIADQGFPAFRAGRSFTYRPVPIAVLEQLMSVAEQASSPAARECLVWFLRLAIQNSGAAGIDPRRFQAFFQGDFARHWWRENLVPHPEQPELVSPWLAFFNWLGSSEILGPYLADHTERETSWAQTWQNSFISDPTQLGLLRLLGRLAPHGHTLDLIPRGILDPARFPEARFQLAAILVRLTQPSLGADEAVTLADAAAALLDPPAEASADRLLFETAKKHIPNVPAIGSFALRLHEWALGVQLGLVNCEYLLRQTLRKRASDLQGPGQLQKLGLPGILPLNAAEQSIPV
jgi:hypothetical protein